MDNFAKFYQPADQVMMRWGLLSQRHGDDGELTVEDKLLNIVERIIRNCMSYQTKLYLVWGGGDYKLCQMLSQTNRNKCIDWASAIWQRIVRYTTVLATVSSHTILREQLRNFDDLYLNHQSVYQRETLAEVFTTGVTPQLEARTASVFSSALREKGIEDVFRFASRLYKKGTEKQAAYPAAACLGRCRQRADQRFQQCIKKKSLMTSGNALASYPGNNW